VPTIHRSALLPYAASKMYRLVNDIEAYPQFLPWCRSARILLRNEDEVRASIELVRGGIHKSFTTLNRLQKNKMIEMRLIDGPFHHLEGFWRFDSLDENACKIRLDMDFQVSGGLTRLTFGVLFNQIANTWVDAFCQRAAELHGRP
jgi:Oligoketide cyclase/lipid transport protein